MQYDLLIKRTLRDAQGILRANLPPAKNLPDDQAVKSLRAIVRTPQVREALERGNDTALCFVLRAVNRILSDDDQPDRTTINRLWDVLDEPELKRAMGSTEHEKTARSMISSGAAAGIGGFVGPENRTQHDF
jgi:hypothetical protein